MYVNFCPLLEGTKPLPEPVYLQWCQDSYLWNQFENYLSNITAVSYVGLWDELSVASCNQSLALACAAVNFTMWIIYSSLYYIATFKPIHTHLYVYNTDNSQIVLFSKISKFGEMAQRFSTLGASLYENIFWFISWMFNWSTVCVYASDTCAYAALATSDVFFIHPCWFKTDLSLLTHWFLVSSFSFDQSQWHNSSNLPCNLG